MLECRGRSLAAARARIAAKAIFQSVSRVVRAAKRRKLRPRHRKCRRIAGTEPGRSMKLFRFSLKARKTAGARRRAISRIRRNGTFGTSMTPASRMVSPLMAALARARFSANVRLEYHGIQRRSLSSGGKSETIHSGSSGKISRMRPMSARFSSSVPEAKAILIFGKPTAPENRCPAWRAARA